FLDCLRSSHHCSGTFGYGDGFFDSFENPLGFTSLVARRYLKHEVAMLLVGRLITNIDRGLKVSLVSETLENATLAFPEFRFLAGILSPYLAQFLLQTL